MNKNMNILKVAITSVLSFALIIGVTYAIIKFNFVGNKDNTILVGGLKFNYNETSSSMTITNNDILSNTEGMKSDNYFDFNVSLEKQTTTGVSYNILLTSDNTNNLSNIKAYLTEVKNNTETKLIDPTTLNNLTKVNNNMKLYSDIIDPNKTKYYRLRLWVDENFGSSQTTSVNGNTSTGTITGFTFKFVVSIGVDNTNTEHYNITNMAQNGSFENTGWNTSTNAVYDSSIKKYGNYSLKVIGNTSAREITVSAKTTMALDNTHKYYVRYEIYHTGSSGTAGFYFPIAEPYFFEGVALSTANKWNVVSKVNNRSSFSTTSSTSYRVDYNNNNSAGVLYFDGLMVVDLTETFGAGNEKSKEWCDINIPFFEGTMDVIINN